LFSWEVNRLNYFLLLFFIFFNSVLKLLFFKSNPSNFFLSYCFEIQERNLLKTTRKRKKIASWSHPTIKNNYSAKRIELESLFTWPMNQSNSFFLLFFIFFQIIHSNSFSCQFNPFNIFLSMKSFCCLIMWD